jgi:hypothetical protein
VLKIAQGARKTCSIVAQNRLVGQSFSTISGVSDGSIHLNKRGEP